MWCGSVLGQDEITGWGGAGTVVRDSLARQTRVPETSAPDAEKRGKTTLTHHHSRAAVASQRVLKNASQLGVTVWNVVPAARVRERRDDIAESAE